MSQYILEFEALLRIVFFILSFIIIIFFEYFFPRDDISILKIRRWVNNISILFLNNLLVRLFIPIITVSFSIYIEKSNIGIMNILNLPLWINIFICIFLLDLSIYVQHIVFHKVPFLWRIHRVHHSDINIDVTTGIRFHPLEIFISLFYKFILIAIIGVPALAVIIFEILLNSSSMFNHSNIKINSKLEKFLSSFLVTPDMHHVHHSICLIQSNKNFGFNLNIWDKFFGTYLKLSTLSVISIKKGVKMFRSNNDIRIDKLIYQPLIKDED